MHRKRKSLFKQQKRFDFEIQIQPERRPREATAAMVKFLFFRFLSNVSSTVLIFFQLSFVLQAVISRFSVISPPMIKLKWQTYASSSLCQCLPWFPCAPCYAVSHLTVFRSYGACQLSRNNSYAAYAVNPVYVQDRRITRTGLFDNQLITSEEIRIPARRGGSELGTPG